MNGLSLVATSLQARVALTPPLSFCRRHCQGLIGNLRGGHQLRE